MIRREIISRDFASTKSSCSSRRTRVYAEYIAIDINVILRKMDESGEGKLEGSFCNIGFRKST